MSTRIIVGDCRDVLKTLPDASVHCCVTSPPYFGLRNYGMAEQIGLESTPDAYVAELVAVFREVRRVLRDDGTLWLNLGDSYANDGKWGGSSGGKHVAALHGNTGIGRSKRSSGLKPKDLLGIPWRVAFALQADGWWLRQDIVWSKGNPMPESVRDRFCKSHEYLFLLAKSERYYFDMDAVLEPCESSPSDLRKMAEQQERIGGKHKDLLDPLSKASSATNIGRKRSVGGVRSSGNKERKFGDAVGRTGSHMGRVIPWEGMVRTPRSVWNINTAPFAGAHFATFPPALIEPCILAGCPEGGTCLDPFGGAGTTGLVADRLHRNAILIELNPTYRELAELRIAGDAPLFAEVTS